MSYPSGSALDVHPKRRHEKPPVFLLVVKTQNAFLRVFFCVLYGFVKNVIKNTSSMFIYW